MKVIFNLTTIETYEKLIENISLYKQGYTFNCYIEGESRGETYIQDSIVTKDPIEALTFINKYSEADQVYIDAKVLEDPKPEPEEIEYSYSCSSSVIWGSFDYGTVWARSEEEAREKAREEITQQLEAINNRLEEIGQRVEINLDCLEIGEAKDL